MPTLWKIHLNDFSCCLFFLPFRTNSVIIIEISGKTSSPTKSKLFEEDDIVKMGSSPQMYDSFVTSFTFECPTQWKESLMVIQQLYKSKALCDFTLKCRGSSFVCHRLVLASCSPYFRAMFMSEMIESRENSLEVKDIDEKTLEALVEFMYTSKIVLTVDNVQKILFAASLLQIDIISEACSNFMKHHLHPSNCLGVRSFADQHGCTKLSGAADCYAHEHFLEVVSQDEFYHIESNHLLDLIESPNIMIEKEIQVYDAVMKWVKYDPANREIHLAELLKKVQTSDKNVLVFFFSLKFVQIMNQWKRLVHSSKNSICVYIWNRYVYSNLMSTKCPKCQMCIWTLILYLHFVANEVKV